jgi:uncharacterized membrane-anchored protein
MDQNHGQMTFDESEAAVRELAGHDAGLQAAPSRYPFRNHPLMAAAFYAGRIPFAAALKPPVAISHFATLSADAPLEADREHLGWLCYSVGATPPAVDADEHVVEFKGHLLHWRHEAGVSAYTVVRRTPSGDAFAENALDGLPEDWMSGLNGERLFGLHLFYEEATGPERNRASLARLFGRDDYIGCEIGGGVARLWADWRGDADGFPRVLLRDAGMTPREAGRVVTDLIRFERSRMSALMHHVRLQSLGEELASWEMRLHPLDGETIVDAEAVVAVRHGLAAHHDDRVALATCVEHERAAMAALSAIGESRVQGLMPLADFLGHSLAATHRDLRDWAERLELIERSLDRVERELEADDRLRLAEALQVQTSVMARTAQQQLQNRRLVSVLGFVGLTAALAYLGQLIGDGLAAAGLVGDAGLISISAVPVALVAAYGLIYGLARRPR